ncbi:MAG TPA: acyl-CoA dehydrogenase C-terminal domain-containing protein [Rhizomicrobium sp.]|nr:acyl-CoA dehydrogenase C-terminal domain-containing protein [Rhizomicrobium sp.]
MQTYKAPLRDMRFVLHELHGDTKITDLSGCADFTPELIDSVLQEAGKFAEQVLLPLNASGDEEGCHYENGVVRTPKGFKDAYHMFREGGWTGITCDPQHGGQGLAQSVAMLVFEMFNSANMAFSIYALLNNGAYEAIAAHGSDEQKNLYLPKLTEGAWTGTMCLTEEHSGSDVGIVRTKAAPQDDGTYRISGTKLFISGGEHDLAENIVHLVLARLPGAPAGVKGISLFIVPKFLPTADGGVGPRNGVVCASIEHKMGINANATAQLVFDDATGWILGRPNKGLSAMFAMMNAARLGVGMQGIGIGEVAYQSAVAYARDRIQGRALSGAKDPSKPADPIIVHPDVRRMLLTMRANTEGCRALGAWVSRMVDIAHRSPDPERREEAEDFVELMTPIVKALFTDLGLETANLGMQVYGGHGYVRDHGVEQFVRDGRIMLIYEGTNGIQALDLVGRKLPAHAGRSLRGFFHPVAAFIEENRNHPMLGEMVKGYEKAFGALQLATAHIATKGLSDPEEVGASASEYLRLFGLVALGYIWARSAKLAQEKMMTAGSEDGFYQAKLQTARFYFERILPQAGSLLSAIKSGKNAMMSFNDGAF